MDAVKDARVKELIEKALNGDVKPRYILMTVTMRLIRVDVIIPDEENTLNSREEGRATGLLFHLWKKSE